MGERGPLKLPGHLAAVRDDGADQVETAADLVEAVAPDKPPSVKKVKALDTLWDQVVPTLADAGLISPADGLAVEMALMHFLTARRAFDVLKTQIVVDDAAHQGVKKNPAEAVMRAESELFLKYAQQLGMTFVSRARTSIARGSDDGEGNPFGP